MISPCSTHPLPVDLPVNTDGQSLVGPSVYVTVRSCSKTPESGETSVIGLPALPTVEMVVELDPLSIFVTTVVSLIVSSPWAETL